MARKNVRGGDKVRRNFKATMQTQANKARIAVTKAAFVVGSRSDQYVPIDTSALLNSRFTKVIKINDGWRGIVGYTNEYAIYLHGTKTYSPLWRPRPVGTKVYDQGKGQGARIKTAANMDATPQWLPRGAEESETTIRRIFAEELRV